VNLGENAQLKPEFLALNPNREIPVLDDGGLLVNLKMPMLMELPRVVAWVERIGARPAVQRGMKVPS
jgi:glutathione S-transferase